MPQPSSLLPTEGFVRIHQVLSMFPIGKTKLWEMVKTGAFPQPRKLGPKTTVWDISELRAFKERIAKEGSV